VIAVLSDAWEAEAEGWVRWARAPGHDSCWTFHRDSFLALLPGPGRLTLDVGCGAGRLTRDLAALVHRVIGLDRLLVEAVREPRGTGDGSRDFPWVLDVRARKPG
jgi:SAM-dependent methyltransferase